MNKIYFAIYSGSAPFKTAAEIAKQADVSENEAIAELDGFIRAGRVVQLCENGKYVFAHKAAIK